MNRRLFVGSLASLAAPKLKRDPIIDPRAGDRFYGRSSYTGRARVGGPHVERNLDMLKETIEESLQRTKGGVGKVEGEEREYAVTGSVRVTVRLYAKSIGEARELAEQRLKEFSGVQVDDVDILDAEEI